MLEPSVSVRPRKLQRPCLAMACGALVGGVLVAAYVTGTSLFAYPVEDAGFAPDVQTLLGWGLFAFILGAVVFSVGLALVGFPAWVLLRRYRLESPRWAVAAGFVLAPAPGLVLGMLSGNGPDLSFGELLLALAGAAVGWVIWRIAYRTER